MQQLTAHVERQVSRVDHAFDKAQVGGQQGFGVVHDEDALHVELQAALFLAVPQVHRRLAGQVQQLRVLGAAFHAVVGVGQWRLKVVADLLVELVVLLLRNVFLGARPDGAGLVDGFPLAGLDHAAGLATAFFVRWVDQFAVFPLFLFHLDGQADVVGILVDDVFDFPGLGVVLGVVTQVQDDAGAALGAGDVFYLKSAAATGAAVADPAHAFAGLHAGAARLDRDLVGHDKAGVKAHAKLADQLRVGLLVARQLGYKIFGAALGNGAQIVNGFLCAHANAVVGDGECFGVFVKSNFDLQLGVALVQAAVVDGLKTQFVASVGRVRDQFAQKNFLVGIQRMCHQVQ